MMTFVSIPQHSLDLIARALNAYLRLDPASAQRLNTLRDKIVTLELLPFHLSFQCLFTPEGVKLVPGETHIATLIIRGTPLCMLGLALTQENKQRFFADTVIIEGNVTQAQEVMALFEELDIDWEEWLSQATGDVLAHQAGRIASKLRAWRAQTCAASVQDLSEYLHEERAWFPSKEALRDFFAEVDTIRMDVDRLAARLQYLEDHLIDVEHTSC